MKLVDLAILSKPRITAMAVITAAGGMWLAPGTPTVALVVFALLGTTLAVGGANTLNMWLERDRDARMTRTAGRPLPQGRLSPAVALAWGLAQSIASVPLLALLVNPLTGLLAAVALVGYVLVYTPLKPRSSAALWVGAVPGAMPPLMGWTASTGRLDLPGIVLFGILFLWQIPHFVAIAIYRHDDYVRAGFQTIPGVYGETFAKWVGLACLGALVPLSLAVVPLGLAGRPYALAALVLGTAFLASGAAGLRPGAGPGWARRHFLVSIAYLTALFVALAL
jgi:protoheme IX farnesyltransferase